jgi:hypothetical protein
MHADNTNERSLLKKLSVDTARDLKDDQDSLVDPDGIRRRWENEQIYGGFSNYIFALEPLVALQPALQVQELHIAGIPDWFSTCLKMAVEGKGGELARIEWPTKTIRRTVDGRKGKKKIQVTTRAWGQAVWDWRAFAQRNDIELPESADRLFEVS